MRVSSSKNIRHLEKKINHRFKNRSLIREALTHKSFAKEQRTQTEAFNERLEFLGDSVLELIISEHLFLTYRDRTEAELSKIKAYTVQEKTLAQAASGLGIGEHLLLGKGEEAGGGREKASLLANAFEAVLAAVYLDAGLRKARAFALNSLGSKIEEHVRGRIVFDYKTLFQEMVQEKLRVLPRYVVQKEKGPEHRKTFEVTVFVKTEVYGTGQGKNKKAAEQIAAKAGLEKLEKQES